MNRLVVLLLAALVWAPGLVANAQERPSAALLATTASGGVQADVATSFDRVLRSELDSMDQVRLHGSVALNLEDVQLALGCEGETQACLGSVAREVGVRYLLLPNLDRVGSELLLSVARFDSQADESARRVQRRASGDEAAAALVVAVPGLLAELFGLEASDAAPEPGATDPEADGAVDPALDPADDPTLGLPPPRTRGPDDVRAATAGVLTFAGIGALGLGVGFGVSTLDRQAAYERAPTDTELEAEDAARRLEETREDALVANVLYVVGGVATAAGLAWLIAELVSGSEEEPVALTPVAAPGYAGADLRGAF